MDHVNELFIIVAGHVELVEPGSSMADADQAVAGTDEVAGGVVRAKEKALVGPQVRRVV